jgi:hypothetical protein
MRRFLCLFGFVALVTVVPSFADKLAPSGTTVDDPPSICDAIAGNLVQNCGFETGDFTDWTQTGDTSFTGVTGGGYANSGTYGAYLGSVSSNDYLSQTITDSAGTVTLEFWLENEYTGPDDFSVMWDGVTVFGPLTNVGPFGYTEEGPIALTSTGSDTLTFVSLQLPSYWGLDDISVVQSTSVVPEPTSIVLVVTVVGLCFVTFRKRASRRVA